VALAAGESLLAAIKSTVPPEKATKEAAWPEEAIEEEPPAPKVIPLQGANWPQLESGPLFMRDFYLDCIEGAMSNLDPDRRAGASRKFIIMGNRGSKC
jgi:hypothetical protein